MSTAVQNVTSPTSGTRSSTLWPSLALLLIAAMLYFTNLGSAPLRVNAEERNAEVVRTMVRTDDYVLPRVDDRIRLNKPPLLYWTATGAAELAGGFSLAALRLPSALGALGVLSLVLLWGRTLQSATVALVGATLLSLCYLFVQQARFGSYEMLLTLFSTASVYFAAQSARSPSWGVGVAAAAAFCLALMTKGTPAAATALLPVAVWLIGMKQGRQLVNWRALLLFTIAVLGGVSWYLYIFTMRPETREIIEAVVLLPFGVQVHENSGARHYEAPWFFFVKIWDEAFPVSLLLPLVIYHVWKERMFPAGSVWRLVTLSFLLPFLVFSAIPQKQDHYLLPMLPFLALLAGKSVLWGLKELNGRKVLLYRIPAWILAAGLVVCGPVAACGLWLVNDLKFVAAFSAGTLISCAGATAFVLIRRRQWPRLLVCSGTGLMAVWLVYFAGFLPVVDNFGSGRIYFDPSYDAARWEARFKGYPFLRKLLDVDRGLGRVDDIQEELLEDGAPSDPDVK